MLKKIYFLFLVMPVFNAFATPLNVAYVEVNDHRLENAGCYVRADNNKPFFDIVAIFAANINGSNPDQPEIYFNPQVDELLNHTQQVANLQNQGIKVLLTLLGNHQNAGWSCMIEENAIQNFANEVVAIVNKYHLDGIDIDDEYSTCFPNATSLLRIAKAIKTHPAFKNKLLTKALYEDELYFKANVGNTKLADYIDYGFEMSYYYNDYQARLFPYLTYGLTKPKLMLGMSIAQSIESARTASAYIMKNNYAGMMVYNVDNHSQDFLSAISNIEFHSKIQVVPQCLK